MTDKLEDITWLTLFGEDFFDSDLQGIDPNKPENIPRINAMRKSKIQRLQNFMAGQGSILFDHLKVEIRRGVLDLIVGEETNCTCPKCMRLNLIKMKLQFICNILFILQKVRGVNDASGV